MLCRLLACIVILSLVSTGPCLAEDFDVKGFVAGATKAGRAGMAEKTQPVDARSAVPGEIVVTVIKSRDGR
jgi:hypothetical protein